MAEAPRSLRGVVRKPIDRSVAPIRKAQIQSAHDARVELDQSLDDVIVVERLRCDELQALSKPSIERELMLGEPRQEELVAPDRSKCHRRALLHSLRVVHTRRGHRS
jgi:hypothetical protein